MPSTSAPQQVTELAMASIVSDTLVNVGELGVADIVAPDRPTPIGEIARATECNERALYRALRLLASCGIFRELDDRRFEHTDMSCTLRSDHPESLLPIVRLMQRLRLAHPHLLHSLRTERSAMEAALGEPLFSYLSKHPDMAAIFDAGMPSLHGNETTPMLDAYDFASVTTLMDLGGGGGTLLAETLTRHPHMRGVLFDLDHVVERAVPYLAAQGLEERCRVQAGDFFERVPPGADTILMRHILHDFPDDAAARILSNCRAALPVDGSVLVVEAVVPPGNGPSPAKVMDIAMLLYPGGMERTVEEFRTLLGAAGFELTSVTPTTSMVSVIEGRPC